MKFFELRAEVMVPKLTRAEVRLPESYFIIDPGVAGVWVPTYAIDNFRNF